MGRGVAGGGDGVSGRDRRDRGRRWRRGLCGGAVRRGAPGALRRPSPRARARATRLRAAGGRPRRPPPPGPARTPREADEDRRSQAAAARRRLDRGGRGRDERPRRPRGRGRGSGNRPRGDHGRRGRAGHREGGDVADVRQRARLEACLEGGHEGARARPPVFGPLGRALEERAQERLRHRVRGRERQRLLHVLHEDGDRRVRREGHAPGEHLVGHDAERVDVGRGADVRRRGLLRGHVVRRPGDHAGGGEAARGLEHLRDPEVGEVDAAVLVEEHVLRLHVAVDDALAVRVVEGVRHPAQDLDRPGQGDAPRLEQLRERAARHEPHRHPGDALRAVDVVGVDGDDVRVLEPRDGLGLALEALGETGVVQELPRQDLERHVAVEGRLEGPVDRGHAAPAERLDDAVGAGVRSGDESQAGDLRPEAYHRVPAFAFEPRPGV